MLCFVPRFNESTILGRNLSYSMKTINVYNLYVEIIFHADEGHYPRDNFHLEGLGVWRNVSLSEVVCLGLINCSLFSFKLSQTSFSPRSNLDFVNFVVFVFIHDFLWELGNPSTFLSSHFHLSCASVDSLVVNLKGKL